jgi:predicted transcriptional regulator
MASATVRISEKTRKTLRELAAKTGESMQSVLDRAVEEYRREQFMKEVNAAYAALRADPEAWADWQKELAVWDATLMDGLDPNERWTADGEVTYVESAAGGQSGARGDLVRGSGSGARP